MPRKPPGDGDGKVIPIKATDREPKAPAAPRRRTPANGRKTNAAAITVAQRRADAIGLRRAGLSFTKIAEAIAAKYNLPSYDRACAFRDVKDALDRIVEEPARELKAEELDRLAALQSAHWKNAMDGDVPATLMILRIMQHRAKLVGLESPIKHDILSSDRPELKVDLTDPAELQRAGLDLLDELAAASAPRRRAAQRTSEGS